MYDHRACIFFGCDGGCDIANDNSPAFLLCSCSIGKCHFPPFHCISHSAYVCVAAVWIHCLLALSPGNLPNQTMPLFAFALSLLNSGESARAISSADALTVYFPLLMRPSWNPSHHLL